MPHAACEQLLAQPRKPVLRARIEPGDVSRGRPLSRRLAAQHSRHLTILPRRVKHVGKPFLGCRHVPRASVEDLLRDELIITVGVLSTATPKRLGGKATSDWAKRRDSTKQTVNTLVRADVSFHRWLSVAARLCRASSRRRAQILSIRFKQLVQRDLVVA